MKHGESLLQQSCLKWFRLQYPKLTMNLFAISNEGARTKANGARLKAQGMLAGTADMFLAIPQVAISDNTAIVKPGVFIEFKFGKNRQTDSQREFQKAVEGMSYLYELIYDFDSFKNLIENYLK